MVYSCVSAILVKRIPAIFLLRPMYLEFFIIMLPAAHTHACMRVLYYFFHINILHSDSIQFEGEREEIVRRNFISICICKF